MSKNYQIAFSTTCKIRALKKMFVLSCRVITITLLLDKKISYPKNEPGMLLCGNFIDRL